VIKTFWPGVALAALLVQPAVAATPRAQAPAWVVVPGQQGCRTDIELTGMSGKGVAAALVSDGDGVNLVFPKADAPEQAFLPIRVDHKPYSNLVLKLADGRSAAIQLSDEALNALRKGGALQIGWLADEPVQIALAGSDQAISDLRTCGAQVAERYRAKESARMAAAAKAEADTRAQAVADEQLAAAKAQKAAAEAERERASAEADRLRAEADAARDRAEQQQVRAETDSYPRGYRDDAYDPRRQDPDDAYDPRYAPYPCRRW